MKAKLVKEDLNEEGKDFEYTGRFNQPGRANYSPSRQKERLKPSTQGAYAHSQKEEILQRIEIYCNQVINDAEELSNKYKHDEIELDTLNNANSGARIAEDILGLLNN